MHLYHGMTLGFPLSITGGGERKKKKRLIAADALIYIEYIENEGVSFP